MDMRKQKRLAVFIILGLVVCMWHSNALAGEQEEEESQIELVEEQSEELLEGEKGMSTEDMSMEEDAEPEDTQDAEAEEDESISDKEEERIEDSIEDEPIESENAENSGGIEEAEADDGVPEDKEDIPGETDNKDEEGLEKNPSEENLSEENPTEENPAEDNQTGESLIADNPAEDNPTEENSGIGLSGEEEALSEEEEAAETETEEAPESDESVEEEEEAESPEDEEDAFEKEEAGKDEAIEDKPESTAVEAKELAQAMLQDASEAREPETSSLIVCYESTGGREDEVDSPVFQIVVDGEEFESFSLDNGEEKCIEEIPLGASVMAKIKAESSVTNWTLNSKAIGEEGSSISFTLKENVSLFAITSYPEIAETGVSARHGDWLPFLVFGAWLFGAERLIKHKRKRGEVMW